MSDPYRWIDPFKEIDAARVEAHREFQRGQDLVLRQLGGEIDLNIEEAFKQAIVSLCHHMAHELVKPHILKHAAAYQQLQNLRRSRVKELGAIAQPIVHHTLTWGRLTYITASPEEEEFAIAATYEVVEPFKFSVLLCPSVD